MGLFDLFKPKKSEPVSEHAFLTEMKALEKKYNTISKADFAKLDDNELLDGMLYWTSNKLWNKKIKMDTLPEPVQVAYACFSVYNEIMNGGLNQAFFNDTKHYIHLCVHGYDQIGAPEISTIIKKAMDIVSNQKGRYEALDDATLDRFLESYEDDPLGDLDSEFYEISDEIDLIQKIIDYIRNNISSFGN